MLYTTIPSLDYRDYVDKFISDCKKECKDEIFVLYVPYKENVEYFNRVCPDIQSVSILDDLCDLNMEDFVYVLNAFNKYSGYISNDKISTLMFDMLQFRIQCRSYDIPKDIGNPLIKSLLKENKYGKKMEYLGKRKVSYILCDFLFKDPLERKIATFLFKEYDAKIILMPHYPVDIGKHCEEIFHNVYLLLHDLCCSFSDVIILNNSANNYCDFINSIFGNSFNFSVSSHPESVNMVQCPDIYSEVDYIMHCIQNNKKKLILLLSSNQYIRKRVEFRLLCEINQDDSKNVNKKFVEANDHFLNNSTDDFYSILYHIIRIVHSDFDSIELLSFLKYRCFVIFGEEYLICINEFENNILRNVYKKKGLLGIKLSLQHSNLKKIYKDYINEVLAIFEQFIIFSKEDKRVDVSVYLDYHVEIFDKIVKCINKFFSTYSINIKDFYNKKECLKISFKNIKCNFVKYNALFSLIYKKFVIDYDYTIKKFGNVTICSVAELKYIPQADLVIFSGCNEDDWTSNQDNFRFVPEYMHKKFEFIDHNNATKLYSYYLYYFLHSSELYITRSEYLLDKESVPHLYWIYLSKFYSILEYKKDNSVFVEVTARQKASISPSVHLRPKILSATAIELLMRDPYGFYLKYILKITLPNPIDKPVSASDFGIIIHDVFAWYVKNYENIKDKYKETLQYAMVLVQKYPSSFEGSVLWPRKFEQYISKFIELDQANRNDTIAIYAEHKCQLYIEDLDVRINARCDRIEYLSDGTLSIIDYKTGSKLPTNKDVLAGFSPQLAIQALAAESELNIKVSKVSYWHFVQDGIIIKDKIVPDIVTFKDEAYSGIYELIKYFCCTDSVYHVVPDESKEPEYNEYSLIEHLVDCI